jgi:dipeptide transport system permease protein
MNTRSSSPGHLALQRFLRNRTAVSGLVFLLLATAVSVLAPWVMATEPNQGSESPFVSPGASHWMGTDIHGRDLFSRVLVGTRISLLVGAVGAGVSVLIGVTWGLVSGWRGGRTDTTGLINLRYQTGSTGNLSKSSVLILIGAVILGLTFITKFSNILMKRAIKLISLAAFAILIAYSILI